MLAGNQLDGADGVVVAGDDVVDLVGIAVGVHDGHDRDAQNAGLGHGDVLLAGINDEQRAGQLLHVADAAQVLLELFALVQQLDDFLLGQHVELPFCSILSIWFRRSTRLRMVRKLVSIPPSQRLLT